MSKKEIVRSTIDVVRAYVAGNKLPLEELPRLVKVVGAALCELERSIDEDKEKRRTPAVAIRKSVSRNHIVCLEDGKKLEAMAIYKSLAKPDQPKHVSLAAKRGLLTAAAAN